MYDFNGLKVSNRMLASTAFKYGLGYDFAENPWAYFWTKLGLMNVDDFGAFITKTITVPERSGFYENKLDICRVIRIYPSRVLNRFGWNNCGILRFTAEVLPRLGYIRRCIVSIGALKGIEEIFYMLKILNAFDIAAAELNISCHNVDLCFLEDLKTLEELFRKSRKISKHPLIIKICAESDYISISKIAEKEGINLIHAINTLRVYSPVLEGYCGQSSWKNKAVALSVIRDLRKNGIKIPIIGGSGIWSMKDTLDFENAGADLFSMSHQFLYFPFWPGYLSRKLK